jgi:hypothetical protein
MLTLEKISCIGSLLYHFPRIFSDCFGRSAQRKLLGIYMLGLQGAR